ncbi:MAG: hypothetical protein C4293_22560 [Nitrospiraceae bacterium]
MTDQSRAAALDLIQRQIRELDAIYKQASEDLNTVAGNERVEKWKKRTVPLLAQFVGQKEAQQFSNIHPGPSFTNDLLEELGDDIEVYRSFLVKLSEQLKKSG